MAESKAPKRRRRKNSKYAPLIWIITGAAIAFLIAYSGPMREQAGRLFTPKSSAPSSSSSRQPVSQGSSASSTGGVSSSVSSSRPSSSDTASSQPGNLVAVKIVLASEGKDSVRLVERELRIPQSPSLLKDTLTALIAYRNDASLLNLVPLKAKVNRVWIDNGVANIDFNSDFGYNSEGQLGYTVQIYQVVHTATQFATVKAVNFYVNGKLLRYLGGDGFELKNPVYPYSSLPRFTY